MKHNGDTFGNQKLNIVCSGKQFDAENEYKDTRYYHTNSKNGGNCPKPFISMLLGDEVNSTIVLNANDYEIDVCNCYISYKPHPKGTFRFKSNVVFRHKTKIEWNSKMINTQDALL